KAWSDSLRSSPWGNPYLPEAVRFRRRTGPGGWRMLRPAPSPSQALGQWSDQFFISACRPATPDIRPKAVRLLAASVTIRGLPNHWSDHLAENGKPGLEGPDPGCRRRCRTHRTPDHRRRV